MGFSVHQPAIGAPLQFFPAMGSKQLDEMISAYVPGNAPIADKRATVSMEFFEHTMATGELFKFFMVYPSLGSITESPASSMLDSGYVSNFTSPVISESQWTPTSNASSSSSESNSHKSSSKKSSLSNDFSHLPGMKIMTRDGRDVTNSASRGCKTKEQRDHAHLMRIIKACDSCRRKKVRCDPSHRRSAGSSTAKTSRKTKKTAAAALPSSAPPQPALDPLEQFLFTPSDSANDTSLSFDSAMSEPLVDPTMDWDQFVRFDEEPSEVIPYDYDFFFDPAGHLSPTSSNSFSSSQPITPARTLDIENVPIVISEGGTPAPLPPYLNPGGEAGNNYADFNLYSPGSSTYLDDDPSLSKEVAAVSRPEYTQYSNHQRRLDDYSQETSAGGDQNPDAQLGISSNAVRRAPLFGQEQISSPAGLDRSLYDKKKSCTISYDGGQPDQTPERHIPVSPDRLRLLPSMRTDELHSHLRTGSSAAVDVPLTGNNVTSTRLRAAPSTLHEFQIGTYSPSTGVKEASPALTDQPSQQSLVTVLTSGTGAWSTEHAALVASTMVTIEAVSGGRRDIPAPSESMSEEKISVPRTTSVRSYGTGDIWIGDIQTSSSSSLRPTEPTRTIVESRFLSISAARFDPEASLERTSLATNSVVGLASQNGASSDTPKQSERLGGMALSVSQSKTDRSTPRSGRLLAILDMMAYYPMLLLTLGALFQWRCLSKTPEGLDMTALVLGPLSIVCAYIKLQQHAIPRVEILDKTTQPLSLTIAKNIKSGFSQLSKDISRARSDFENISFPPSTGCQSTIHKRNHIQRFSSLAW